MYRYINKFINIDELLKELNNVDLFEYSKAEIKEVKKLILEVQNIKNTIPNQTYEKESNKISKIGKELEKVKDSGELYKSVFELLTKNSLVIKYAKKMNNEELFEFITKYIYVPMPPEINQEGFNALTEVGIKNDKREALWRLAFNYNHKKINFSRIEDYFIEKRDSYYLIELISAVYEDLDVDEIIQKVIFTRENIFINEVAKQGHKVGIIDEENIKELENWNNS